MIAKDQLLSVPGFDDVVIRHGIEILQKGGDLVIRNGDIALTRWGDFMLVDEDYSAFFKLVQAWRFNATTLEVLFHASVGSSQSRQDFETEIENLVVRSATFSPRPLLNMDYEAYHKANDAIGAAEIAQGVYAGSIAVVLNNMMQSFRSNIVATQNEWRSAGPLFGGCSVGQILEASANNVRHIDEWRVTRPPTAQQMKSIVVLSAALNEPLDPSDGSRHSFAREISPETLRILSDGVFDKLEACTFAFANSLLKLRQKRLASQAPVASI